MRERFFHVAANLTSTAFLCGERSGPFALSDDMLKNRKLVYCVACLKVAVEVDNVLNKAWYRTMEAHR
jgi:hypothetical protein